jgi:hypothetical protein
MQFRAISATSVASAMDVVYSLTLALIVVSLAQAPASDNAGDTTAGTPTSTA